MQSVETALVVFEQGPRQVQQLRRGLEVITGVPAFIQNRHQAVPTACHDGFGRRQLSFGKGPVSTRCNPLGNARPEQNSRKKPFEKFTVVPPGHIDFQFGRKTAAQRGDQVARR